MHAPATGCKRELLAESKLVGRRCPCKRGFLVLVSFCFLPSWFLFSRLPASTRQSECTVSSKRQGKRVYPGRRVSIKRGACASSVAVVAWWCGVFRPACCVCLPRRARARDSSSSNDGVAESERAASSTETRNGAGVPRAACLRRVSPRARRQVGDGTVEY